MTVLANVVKDRIFLQNMFIKTVVNYVHQHCSKLCSTTLSGLCKLHVTVIKSSKIIKTIMFSLQISKIIKTIMFSF